jgi:uncharacterized protein YjiK
MSVKLSDIVYSMMLTAFLVVFAFVLAKSPTTLAQEDSAYVRKVRVIDAGELGLDNLAGLAYSHQAEVLLTTATSRPEGPQAAGSPIVMITLHETLAGTLPVASSVSDPINMAYDDSTDRLYLLRRTDAQLEEFELGDAGQSAVIADVRALNLDFKDAQGMSFDPKSGRLFILDGTGSRFMTIERDRLGSLDGAAALRDGTASWIELKRPGPKKARGMAYNPADGHLYILSQDEHRLYEVTVSGNVVATRDLSDFHLKDPRGMVFAPTGDPTDEAQEMSLYVVDGGVGSSGGIVEFSLAEPVVQSADEYHTVQAALVETIRTSQFVPPSPDPAGVAYLSSINRLLISDSEVDEMPIFAGVNLFETTLSGSVVYTASTTTFSYEPTGVAFNPHDGHIFFSDDGPDRVFELNPGFDGEYGTSDDDVTFFSTGAFGSYDPEGVAFDSVSGNLYVVDGAGKEVYEIAPGANDEFDGVPPAGDDQVTSFDVAIYGILDPEGIESTVIAGSAYLGTLYILDSATRVAIETTTDGEIVRMIDVSAASAVKAAGLAYAPGSVNPDGMNLYIADRGVDNNTEPNENDGKVYEMSLPITPDNLRPTVSAGPDRAITVSDSATLDGYAADDGLPEGSLMTLWKKVSGPGDVTFANERAVDTTATFSAAGVYVLRLIADDTELIGRDEVTVAVNAPPSADAGQDQLVTLPTSATLNGTVTDEGLPDPPGQIATVWSKVGGPGSVAFADASALDTTAAFSQAGTYFIRLTADDGELSSSDDLTVTVNQAPDVDAGTGQLVTLPASIVVNGTVTDDGVPDPPGAVTLAWSKASGPGVVTFTQASQLDTTVSFSQSGIHTLRLTADDGAATGSGDVVITVNRAPSVDAGPDRIANLQAGILVVGLVSDDGLPNPPGEVSTTWSKVSGPGTVSFSNANAVVTTASFSKPGTYVLRLAADDGAATVSDDSAVVVSMFTTFLPVVSKH